MATAPEQRRELRLARTQAVLGLGGIAPHACFAHGVTRCGEGEDR